MFDVGASCRWERTKRLTRENNSRRFDDTREVQLLEKKIDRSDVGGFKFYEGHPIGGETWHPSFGATPPWTKYSNVLDRRRVKGTLEGTTGGNLKVTSIAAGFLVTFLKGGDMGTSNTYDRQS